MIVNNYVPNYSKVNREYVIGKIISLNYNIIV